MAGQMPFLNCLLLVCNQVRNMPECTPVALAHSLRKCPYEKKDQPN